MENDNITANGSQTNDAGRKSLPFKRTGKQWVLFGITAFTAIFMFIGLAFPVVHFKQEIFGTNFERTVLGFDVLGGNMPKALESVANALMAFVWLQLLATIACIVVTVLALTVFPQKKAERVQLIVMIISVIFSLIYMIDGLAAVSAGEAGTTATYALFIVVVLLMVGYVVCMKCLPETLGIKKSKEKSQSDGDDVAERIKKYKELYDMGAITEEEYATKKSELLNGRN